MRIKAIRRLFMIPLLLLSVVTSLAHAFQEKPRALITSTNSRSVRSDYEFASPTLGHMKPGEVFSVEIPDDQDDPHCCKILDGPFEGGYILVKNVQYPKNHFWIVRMKGNDSIVYARPESKSKIVGHPKDGMAFAVENAPGGWFHILDGEFRGGYIYHGQVDFVDFSEAAPTPPKPPVQTATRFPDLKFMPDEPELEPTPPPPAARPLNNIRIGGAFLVSGVNSVLQSPGITGAFFQDISRWIPRFRIARNRWELGLSGVSFSGVGRSMKNFSLMMGSSWRFHLGMPMKVALRYGWGVLSTSRTGGENRSGLAQNAELFYSLRFQEKINYCPNLDLFLTYVPDREHSTLFLGVAGSYDF